jgi:hypothetical protein
MNYSPNLSLLYEIDDLASKSPHVRLGYPAGDDVDD